MSFVIDYNAKRRKLQIYTADLDSFGKLRDNFSIPNTTAHFAKRYTNYVPDKLYAITQSGYCELGLYWDIKKYFDKNQIENEIGEGLEQVLTKDKVIPNYIHLKLDLRDYQQNAVDAACSFGGGTYILGTGAGKTLVTAALVESYFKQFGDEFTCIILVPDTGLVEQTYKEFKEYGVTFSLSKWTGKNKLEFTNVIICNIQLFQARFEENQWIKHIDLLVCDEAHKIKSTNSISDLLRQIKTTHRFGFTGTLPKNQMDKWSIIGKFGPVMFEKSSAELRDEGFLTNCEASIIEIQYNTKITRTSRDEYRDELKFIYTNEFRNNLIKQVASKLEGNTLVLVNHLEHSKLIVDCLENIDKTILCVKGEVEVEEREKIKQQIEQSNNVVCVAMSSIFSTGVNIKNINNIILAAGGKSFVRIVQSVGRGLRLHENKTKLKIIDICDRLNYSQEHAAERMSIYREEKIPFKIKSLRQT